MSKKPFRESKGPFGCKIVIVLAVLAVPALAIAWKAQTGWFSSYQAMSDAEQLAKDGQSPEAIKGLIAEFDRVWGTRVTRSRDVVEQIQVLEGSE